MAIYDYSHHIKPPPRVVFKQVIVQSIPAVILHKKRGPKPERPDGVTNYQIEIIKMMVVEGLMRKEVADRLDRHYKTIDKTVLTFYKNTGCHSYIQALKWLFRNNFITLEEFLK